MISLADAFTHPDPSARLQAALAAGMRADLADRDVLLARCATEPDFQVREMLTWALIRLPAAEVVPRLVAELACPEPQARSQALHTLSKFRDPSAWPAVAERLDDTEPHVYRTAWYAAVALAPTDQQPWLAQKLATRLGEGDRDLQLSLSRALLALGPEIVTPLLEAAARHPDEAVRDHAAATQRLLEDPDSGFAPDLARARREVALGRTRSAKG